MDFHCDKHAKFQPVCGGCDLAKRAYWRKQVQTPDDEPEIVKPVPSKLTFTTTVTPSPDNGKKLIPVVSVKDLPAPDPMPLPPLRARRSDPTTSDDGIARIRETLLENRLKILALNFPPQGLNYRQIAEQADIYPTTCSRVITTMFREGSLERVGKDKGGFLYLPGTASNGAVGE